MVGQIWREEQDGKERKTILTGWKGDGNDVVADVQVTGAGQCEQSGGHKTCRMTWSFCTVGATPQN
jgi:hypothetical protein